MTHLPATVMAHLVGIKMDIWKKWSGKRGKRLFAVEIAWFRQERGRENRDFWIFCVQWCDRK